MKPNSYFGGIVTELNALGLILDGCGLKTVELCGGEKVLLESGNTKKGERYLRGSLILPTCLNPFVMIYGRKVQVIIGESGASGYLGRNAGFYLGNIPEGEFPIRFEFDRRREIRTTKQQHQAMQRYNRKQTKKKYRRVRTTSRKAS